MSRTARSCVQVALARPNHGGRHSKNGDSKWTKISDAYAVPDDVYDKIFLPEPPDIMLLAGEVNTNLTDLLFGLEEGGGGWSNANRAGGKSSTVTGDITWRLRCKSHNAYKCPAAVQLVLRVPDRAMHLEHAVGWLHNHSGELHTSVGLPPSVKVIIDNIISSHPGIKCASVKNQLWENYNVSKEMFESKVETYFYKGCAVRRKSLDVSTGISSFGAAQAFCESHQLFDVLPNHTVGLNSGYLDVPGVVGHYLDTSKDRCVIQLGTVKTLLDTWLQSTFGLPSKSSSRVVPASRGANCDPLSHSSHSTTRAPRRSSEFCWCTRGGLANSSCHLPFAAADSRTDRASGEAAAPIRSEASAAASAARRASSCFTAGNTPSNACNRGRSASTCALDAFICVISSRLNRAVSVWRNASGSISPALRSCAAVACRRLP